MNPYYEQKILAAEPVELVRIVYQRAISCVRDAREHLRDKQIAERSMAISRAYEALRELLLGLKPEAAPELCQRLGALYCYMQQRLLDANMQQTDGPLAEVLGLLTTLEEAWAEAYKQIGQNGQKSSSGQTPARHWNGAEQIDEPTSRYALSV